MWEDFQIGKDHKTCHAQSIFDNSHLSENQLEKLPSEINSLKNLESLSLDANNFKEFPEFVMDLRNLEYLGLGWNQISNIPESIKKI